jgi:hypothetical protein
LVIQEPQLTPIISTCITKELPKKKRVIEDEDDGLSARVNA